MLGSQPRGSRNRQIVAIRFQREATAEEVVAWLLESVRRTGLSLLTVLGDGQRVYPRDGRNSGRRGSSWRAELTWCAGAPTTGWRLQVFLGHAEILLGCPGGIRLEPGAGQRNLTSEVVN